MNADGSRQTNVSKSRASEDWPAWSPNGATIAFTRSSNGKDAVYVMNADGSNVRRLAAGTQPSWSRDGRRIAFTNESSGRSAIYVVGSDGKGLKRLTHSRFTEYDPAWVPV